WVKDAAGNVSAGPVSATITLSTTPPPDPSLTLHDRTTGSPDFTNARVVSATVADDAEATAWLLSETQTTPPTEDNPDWTTTEPITFELTTAGDGEKTVYAWVKDAAGNVSAGPVSATIFVDTRAPTVIVTVPTQAATTPVTVSWEADDPAPSSDNLTYRVHYRQDDADWKTWYESTTLTTADFVSTTLGHTYTFSVTAQDAAGNAGHGQATLRYEKFKVFIPLTSRNWAAWYAEDLNEPNDTRDQSGANILLEPNKIYEAYIWHADDNDYYAYSGQSGNIRIHLDLSAKGLNPDVDYDLYIYDGETGEMVAWSNYTKVPTEEVEFSAEAEKKYYIRVYPFQGYNNDVPYKLTIHDPG
ncbi:MAG: pre-peptidase C-terminal domain-containing protein, partial [Anaerolineae bacterium]